MPWLALIGLTVAGCGGNAAATTKPTPHKHATAALATSPALTVTAPVPTATDGPTPSPTHRARVHRVRTLPAATPFSLGPGRVVAASVRPASVAPGGTLTASVMTSGSVGRVQLYLGSGMPNASAPLTFTLTQVSTGAWSAAGTAPSEPGTYHYTVGLYVGGHRSVIDNNVWNIQVTGSGSSATGPQPLPDDIPEAPPFSWGNPAGVVFSALGHSVNGSEVTSTTRSDVAPATVAAWYTSHMPRAGWTVDSSTEPAAGATSFTIVGTMSGASGTRVCIVQYAAYTIHIFYGTIPG